MAKPWARKRERKRSADAPARRRSGDRRADDAHATTDDRAIDDLDDRLASVSSAYERPPTAEELRAAFGGGRRTPEPEARARPEATFDEQFSAESLFAEGPIEFPEPEPERAEDRSRTAGDYFYDPVDAWEVLGLEPGASWEQITAAHRRLAKRHHPDRLLAASPEEQAASEAAMRDVNVAYSVLRRMTGN